MDYDLIVIGNPVYDEITTPYITTGGRVLSGCSTNAAIVAKKLGIKKVGLIGAIGPDYYETFLNDLRKFSIDPVEIIRSDKTGGFKLNYFENGDRTLETLGVANNIEFEELSNETLEKLESAKWIMLGPILQEIDRSFISSLRKITSANLFLDPQGLIRIVEEGRIKRVCNREEIRRIISLVNIVKPNEYESEIITGEPDPAISAKILQSWGADTAIVTLGDRGSIISFNDAVHRIPAYSTFAKDPTGAGDSYAGAFISAQLKGKSLLESAVYASAASSIMVEFTGPNFDMDEKKVNKRMLELSAKVRTPLDS